jgi:hypothetical protein
MNMGLILTALGTVYLMCCSSSAQVHGSMDVFKMKSKNLVYEHRIKRNQELNHQIFDIAKSVSG